MQGSVVDAIGITPDVEIDSGDLFQPKRGQPRAAPKSKPKRSTRRASLVVGMAVGEGDPVEVRIKRGADLSQVAEKFANE